MWGIVAERMLLGEASELLWEEVDWVGELVEVGVGWLKWG